MELIEEKNARSQEGASKTSATLNLTSRPDNQLLHAILHAGCTETLALYHENPDCRQARIRGARSDSPASIPRHRAMKVAERIVSSTGLRFHCSLQPHREKSNGYVVSPHFTDTVPGEAGVISTSCAAYLILTGP